MSAAAEEQKASKCDVWLFRCNKLARRSSGTGAGALQPPAACCRTLPPRVHKSTQGNAFHVFIVTAVVRVSGNMSVPLCSSGTFWCCSSVHAHAEFGSLTHALILSGLRQYTTYILQGLLGLPLGTTRELVLSWSICRALNPNAPRIPCNCLPKSLCNSYTRATPGMFEGSRCTVHLLWRISPWNVHCTGFGCHPSKATCIYTVVQPCVTPWSLG